jgi:hypothetical protein
MASRDPPVGGRLRTIGVAGSFGAFGTSRTPRLPPQHFMIEMFYYVDLPHHARRLRRSREPRTRRQRAAFVPMVQSGSSGAPVYLLLGFLRARMEASHRPRLSSRTGFRARSRRMPVVRRRHGRGVYRIEAGPRGASSQIAGAVGIKACIAADAVGCRSYPSGSGRRRRMRPG